jgi:beta-1,4-N-acetylglucosaminyltransferase
MAAVNDLAIKVLRRECFVTIGATASFGDLIVACLSEDFLSTLKSLKYTTLTVQYGPDVELFRFHLDEARRLGWADGLTISGFSYNKEGLGAEMRACKRLAGTSMEGVVICHAGE